jgi:hypothetical protein
LLKIFSPDSLLPVTPGERFVPLCPSKGGVNSVHTCVRVVPWLIGDHLLCVVLLTRVHAATSSM